MHTLRTVLVAMAVISAGGCTTLDWSERAENVETGAYRELGTVSIDSELWNPLWRSGKEDRIKEMRTAVEMKARRTYGEGRQIGSIAVEAKWSPLSLVLGLGALGSVENASAIALVYEELPPPPPEPEPEQEPQPAPEPEPVPQAVTIITYAITPPESHRDRYGYMRAEYFPYEATIELVLDQLEKRGAGSSVVERELKKIEPGGMIRIHIGRQELMHADTKWYSYEIVSDGREPYRYPGEEGIPNIRGRDGNWWSIVDLPVRTEISTRLDLRVFDAKIESAYEYSVSRHETIEYP